MRHHQEYPFCNKKHIFLLPGSKILGTHKYLSANESSNSQAVTHTQTISLAAFTSLSLLSALQDVSFFNHLTTFYCFLCFKIIYSWAWWQKSVIAAIQEAEKQTGC